MGLAGPTAIFGFVGACLYGFGLGIVNPTANLSAAALMSGNPATAINLLNFFFSVGATFTPAVIGMFVDAGWSQWFPLCVSIPMLAGALMGLSNTAGTMPGVIGVTVTGYILDATGSWALVFGIAAGLYLAGTVVWLAFAKGEPLFD